jgi:hypothetical protein
MIPFKLAEPVLVAAAGVVQEVFVGADASWRVRTRLHRDGDEMA